MKTVLLATVFATLAAPASAQAQLTNPYLEHYLIQRDRVARGYLWQSNPYQVRPPPLHPPGWQPTPRPATPCLNCRLPGF